MTPAEQIAALKGEVQGLRDEFYAALITMRNYYAQAISRAAVDEQLARGWTMLKQTDKLLASLDPAVEGTTKNLESRGEDSQYSASVRATASKA